MTRRSLNPSGKEWLYNSNLGCMIRCGGDGGGRKVPLILGRGASLGIKSKSNSTHSIMCGRSNNSCLETGAMTVFIEQADLDEYIK